MEKYVKGRSIRDTLFGKVRYGKHIASGTIVVIKEYMKDQVTRRVTVDGRPIAEDACQEIRVHASLCSNMTHPHIVKLHDVQEDATKIYTVLEYCGGGDFFNFINTKGASVVECQTYMRQLMQGVQYLHSRNICHLDLSLENLLVTEQGVLKICDFGVAVEIPAGEMIPNDEKERRPGKTHYMAPEVFQAQPFDPRRADLWSCGVILFLMLFRTYPYQFPIPSCQMFRIVIAGEVERLLTMWKKDYTGEMVELLNALLTPMERRLQRAQDVLSHSFLSQAAAAVAVAAAAVASAEVVAEGAVDATSTATAAAAGESEEKTSPPGDGGSAAAGMDVED